MSEASWQRRFHPTAGLSGLLHLFRKLSELLSPRERPHAAHNNANGPAAKLLRKRSLLVARLSHLHMHAGQIFLYSMFFSLFRLLPPASVSNKMCFSMTAQRKRSESKPKRRNARNSERARQSNLIASVRHIFAIGGGGGGRPWRVSLWAPFKPTGGNPWVKSMLQTSPFWPPKKSSDFRGQQCGDHQPGPMRMAQGGLGAWGGGMDVALGPWELDPLLPTQQLKLCTAKNGFWRVIGTSRTSQLCVQIAAGGIGGFSRQIWIHPVSVPCRAPHILPKVALSIWAGGASN